MDSENEDFIAVFPIPGVVTFPGQCVQLHVFEPRYRKMVSECVAKGREIAVALPESQITSHYERPDSVDDFLKTNHLTFKPKQIMSAGKVRITSKLEDGRFFIEIDARRKVKVRQMVQTLPYYVASVETVPERIEDAGQAAWLFNEMLRLSEAIHGKNYQKLLSQLPLEVTAEKSLERLLVETLKWFVLEPDLQQQLLEFDVMEHKAALLVAIMKAYLQEFGHDEEDDEPDQGQTADVIHLDFSKNDPV